MAGSELALRVAGERDLDDLFTLLSDMHGKPPWEPAKDAEAVRVLRRILSDPARRITIASLDGEPAGTLDLMVVPNLTRNLSPWAIVENVVVAERFRRRGVGRLLIDDAIAHATEQGCYKVQLVSARRRDAAHALYEAAGFDAEVNGYRRYLHAL